MYTWLNKIMVASYTNSTCMSQSVRVIKCEPSSALLVDVVNNFLFLKLHGLFIQHAHALEQLKENLMPGGRALDVGSGSGYLTACMTQMVSIFAHKLHT